MERKHVVTVRMEPELHEALKADAIAESQQKGFVVSLNRLCLTRLTEYPMLKAALHEARDQLDRLGYQD